MRLGLDTALHAVGTVACLSGSVFAATGTADPIPFRWSATHTIELFRDATGEIAVQRLADHSFTWLQDFASGRTGVLMPGAGDSLELMYVESGAHLRSTVRYQVLQEGGATSLVTIGPEGRRIAQAVAIRERQLEVHNGAVVLHGTLVLPARAGRGPAVVFLHGSGAASRDTFVAWGAAFAARGIAAFAYDKRGTGESTGDWRTSTLEDLADDAAAVVAALRQCSDIDPDRIGFLGTSQGPWVASIAASRDPRLAFVVMSNGGGMGGAEQEIFRRANTVRDAGFAAPDVDSARVTVTRYFRYLASGGADSSGVGALWRDHGSSPWFALLDLPSHDPTRGAWPPLRRVFAADLALSWPAIHARMTQPVLAIVCGDDHTVPQGAVLEHLATELPRGKSGQLTSIVLDGADHHVTLPAVAGDIPLVHPKYFPSIFDWVVAQTHASGSGARP